MQPQDSNLLTTDTVSLRLLTEYLSALENQLDEQASAPSQEDLGGETGPDIDPSDQDSGRIRWVPRIRKLDGIDPEKISSAHGRLIAQGYLNFQVEDRTMGLCYRVTPEGRNLLKESVN